MSVEPVIVVHGGAWSIPDSTVSDHLQGVHQAMLAGWSVLSAGGAAVDAVENAVAVMEDCETFDAGRGSFLNREGRAQLDALIMEGEGLRAGAVGCVERIRNPIRAARKVLSESPHAYLVGIGAERFAAEHGVDICAPEDLISTREVERLRAFLSSSGLKAAHLFDPASSHDTVGAVALDSGGNLAAATSTGGTLGKIPGRIGDSSIIGSGCYADNESAAASLTGWGEPIMRLVLAKWACGRVSEVVSPAVVVAGAIQHLEKRLGGHAGIILLDARGRFGVRHNTSRMAWAMRTAQGEHVEIEQPRRAEM